MAAQRSLAESTREVQSSSSKMASGSRIQSAKDDAAGLAISNNLNAQKMGLRQAHRNANDAVSLFQVAEGGMQEQSNMLTRLRELAIQAATDSIGDSERDMLNEEYNQLMDESQRIAESTRFNGKQLLVMSDTPDFKDFQVGLHDDDDSKISSNPFDFMTDENSLGTIGTSVWSKDDARTSLESIDQAMTEISSQRALAGSYQQRLVHAIDNLDQQQLSTSATNSRIRDVDYADEASVNLRAKMKQDASSAVLAQANQIGRSALKLLM
jgi:flagellin